MSGHCTHVCAGQVSLIGRKAPSECVPDAMHYWVKYQVFSAEGPGSVGKIKGNLFFVLQGIDVTKMHELVSKIDFDKTIGLN